MIGPNRLSMETERLLHNELDADETVLWAGQPLPERFARQGIGLVIFGIPWTAFALFWMWMVSGFGHASSGPFIVFSLFGLPFVLIGIGMLTSPVWLRRKATRTAYAVTNKRVLILDGGWAGSTTAKSILPVHLGDRTRSQNADGTGDLLFPLAGRPVRPTYNQGRSTISAVGFYGIPDVKAVDDLIRQTFDEKISRPRET